MGYAPAVYTGMEQGAMGIKWKEDYSARTQRTFGLVIGLVVGALITATILGGLWEWGVVTGAKWWEVMTAFGTVGAVGVAVAFPLWQSAKQARELRLSRLHADWAIAEEAYRISWRLGVIGKDLQKSIDLLPTVELGYLQAQLESAKKMVTARLGRLLIDDLLRNLVVIRNWSHQVERSREKAQRLNPAFRIVSGVREDVLLSFERIGALYEQTVHWMVIILEEYKALGVEAPGAVYSEGKASVQLRAVGKGRVERA